MSRFATRRTFLRAAAVTGTLLPAGVFAQRAFVGGLPKDLLNPEICRASFGAPVVLPEKRALKLTWNATAICTVGVPVALRAWPLRQAQSRRRADQFRRLDRPAAGGDRHRQGRCRRRHGAALAEAAGAGLRRQDHRRHPWRLHAAASPAQRRHHQARPTSRARRSASPILAAPDKNFFSIMLHQAGIDPQQDVEWRVFPGDLLPVALKKGEVQAFSQGDPLGWIAARPRRADRGRHQPRRRIRSPHLLRAGHPRQPDPRGEAGRGGADPGAAGGAGIGRRQSGRGGGDFRAVCAEGEAGAARRHAAQPHPWPSSAGRPTCAQQIALYAEELKSDLRLQAKHRHPEIRRAGLRRPVLS